MWPPNRSDILSAGSILTIPSKLDLLPNVVFSNVSSLTSTVKVCSNISLAVRQIPSTAMLSPIFISKYCLKFLYSIGYYFFLIYQLL